MDKNMETLLELLKAKPRFTDELQKHFTNTTAVSQAYAKLVVAGYPVRRFTYKQRHQSSKSKYKTPSVYFHIYWFEGFEMEVLERIKRRFGHLITRNSWRDLINPICGKDMKHNPELGLT